MIPKHLLINFDSLQAGDKLWIVEEVEVDSTSAKNRDKYPIKLKGNYGETYTKTGKFHENDHVTLVNSNPLLLISEYPKEMWVRNFVDAEWRKEKIYGYEFNKYIGFGELKTFAKDIEPEPPTIELSMEEIIEKVNKLEGKKVIVKTI